LETQTGVRIQAPSDTFFDHKLWGLTQKLGHKNVNALIKESLALPSSPTSKAVLEALLNHETSFFRDPTAFRNIREVIIPDLISKNHNAKKLRIWSAACSWGQEAYSIAMTIAALNLGHHGWDFDILASDCSHRCVESARSGRFSQLQLNRGLPAKLLIQHFEREGVAWRARPALRKMLRFQILNLIEPWPFAAPFDLILIRNVLVYFSPRHRADTLVRLRRLLRPGGVIVFGQSEGLLDLGEGFELVSTRTFNFSRRRE